MTVCKQRLQTLPCNKQGYGFLSVPVRPTDTTIHLMKGHGEYFPELVGDQFFFVRVQGCNGCCETMRVVARAGDKLTVERMGACPCIESNARVSYDHSSREYAHALIREVGLNTKSPLHYDCETNTISLDCNAVMKDSDCGCGSGKNESGVGARGPQGPAGRDGADGLGVRSISIDASNTLTWTDSNGRSHTIGTVTAAQGPVGPVGPAGPAGPVGPAGPQGEDAGSISMESSDDGSFALFLTTGEGEKKVIGTWSPPKGDKGDKGDTGARGPTGPVGTFNMLERAGKVYIAGPVGETVTLRSNGKTVGERIVIPDGGLWQGANPNTGAQAVIELVHNGSVVALGYF